MANSVYFNPAVGGDGSTVTDDSNASTGLGNGGHKSRFVPALKQVVQVAQHTVDKAGEASESAAQAAQSAASAVLSPNTTATSTTSLTIGLGDKVIGIQSGKSLVVGCFLVIANTNDPTQFMYGQVKAYSGTALTVSVQQVGGSGTYASWSVSLSGPAPSLAPLNESKSVDVTAASDINLDSATGNLVHITGSAAITSVALAAGRERTLVFDGVSTLTHSSNLLLPGAANITAAVGDIAVMRGDSTGVRVVSYTRASRSVDLANGVKANSVASAATVNLDNVDGNFVHITGTTTIAAVTIATGVEKTLYFDSALTITHGANLQLPFGGANVSVATGDTMVVRGDGSGKTVVTSYTRADGRSNRASSLELLASVSVTAVASIDFLNILNANYSKVIIEIDGVAGSSMSSPHLNLQVAVGGVAQSAGASYTVDVRGTQGNSNSVFVVPLELNGAGSGANSTVTIGNTNSTKHKTIGVISTWPNGSGGWSFADSLNVFAGGVVTGVRLFVNNGSNFAATGNVRVYGVRVNS